MVDVLFQQFAMKTAVSQESVVPVVPVVPVAHPNIPPTTKSEYESEEVGMLPDDPIGQTAPPGKKKGKGKCVDMLLADYANIKLCNNLMHLEPTDVAHTVVNKLTTKFDVSISNLYSIVSRLLHLPPKSKDKLLFSNMIQNPHDFLTPEDILIPFEIAEDITKQYGLTIGNSTRMKAWAYEYMIIKKKSFQVETRMMKLEMFSYFQNRILVDKFVEKYMMEVAPGWLTMSCYEKLQTTLYDKVYSLCRPYPTLNMEASTFVENYTKINMNVIQKQAVHACITNNFQIICGYPGTGKTTIFEAVKEYFYDSNNAIIACTAPTGLAIKNLMSKCSIKHKDVCGTMHKLVYTVFPYMLPYDHLDTKISERRKKKYKKYNALIPSVIVVDEVSMVDVLMFKLFIKYCVAFNCRVILLGDADQLPPVGPGNPLYAMLHDDNIIPHVIYLEQIMRQDKGILVDNILNIKNNVFLSEKEHFDNETMFLLDYDMFIDDNTKELDTHAIRAFLSNHSLNKYNSQFLTPENHKNCGSFKLNKTLQALYNAKGPTIRQSYFKVHDLVVRTQNTPTMDDANMYANGETGVIDKCIFQPKGPPTVQIVYDNPNAQPQEISIKELHEEFSLRYAMTIHKSQGGEYENVILVMGTPHEPSSWKQSSSKKLLYTAVSRSKERCFVIGKQSTLNIAQM